MLMVNLIQVQGKKVVIFFKKYLNVQCISKIINYCTWYIRLIIIFASLIFMFISVIQFNLFILFCFYISTVKFSIVFFSLSFSSGTEWWQIVHFVNTLLSSVRLWTPGQSARSITLRICPSFKFPRMVFYVHYA